MNPSSRRALLWLVVLGLWLGAAVGLLREWFGHFADPVGLVIRGTIVLTWTGLAWGTMRSWWTEYRQRGDVHQQLSGSRKWHAPMLVVTTGLALLIMADVHSERWDLAVATVVVVPFLAGEFWEHWRGPRARG